MTKPLPIPVTDDHIHIDPVNGRGLGAVKEFQRAGGTHLFLVSKPSWSFGITPAKGEDFIPVFEKTLSIAREIRDLGIIVFPVLGVHPAEITRLGDRMALARVEEIMKAGLEVAAGLVARGDAVALKSGRPHYGVPQEVLDASNRILSYALVLAHDQGCAVQLHAEGGPCADVPAMAREAGLSLDRVVKHFATPETPLVPSFIARHEAIPALAREGRAFMMESDYMDENSRPGSVIGPKSVPRFTRRLLEAGEISEEAAYRIHAGTPALTYGVEILLP
ncbi:MAG TPA: TatD family hydrolase [Methanomicrobiales archaeon]|nr:TatD family hydrolase [Methanomicrobiales archaeon]